MMKRLLTVAAATACRTCPPSPASTTSSAMSSYISSAMRFAKKADRISTLYNSLCRSYGPA